MCRYCMHIEDKGKPRKWLGGWRNQLVVQCTYTLCFAPNKEEKNFLIGKKKKTCFGHCDWRGKWRTFDYPKKKKWRTFIWYQFWLVGQSYKIKNGSNWLVKNKDAVLKNRKREREKRESKESEIKMRLRMS